jgi:thiol-disulfide isomerase/thioredoxin
MWNKCVMLAAGLLLFSLNAAAYDFSMKDTRGHTIHLSDYRGKWVLVNFWATWCAPCREEIPDLISLYNAHKSKDLVVIGVAMEYPNPKTVLDFVKESGMDYPIVLGDYKMAARIGEVRALPTSFLYDQKGEPVSYQPGPITRKDMEEFLRSNQ